MAKVINSTDGNLDPKQDFAYNVFELDAASNNSVDDIRILNEQVRVPPQIGKYKVYIIDEVHMLSQAAFNAFLKTLEEPPPYAIFILATTEKHKIIPTILSRCQVFNFNRIKISDMVTHLQGIALKEGVEADIDALHLVAKKADGGLRDALSIFDQLVSFSGNKVTYENAVEILSILDAEFYFRLTDSFLIADSANALLLYDEILMKGFEGSMFLSGLSEHFRNLLVCLHQHTEKLLDVAESSQEKFRDQAALCSLGWLVNALNITNQFDIDFKTSRNQRLHVELCLIKLSYLKSMISGVSDELKKKAIA